MFETLDPQNLVNVVLLQFYFGNLDSLFSHQEPLFSPSYFTYHLGGLQM